MLTGLGTQGTQGQMIVQGNDAQFLALLPWAVASSVTFGESVFGNAERGALSLSSLTYLYALPEI